MPRNGVAFFVVYAPTCAIKKDTGALCDATCAQNSGAFVTAEIVIDITCCSLHCGDIPRAHGSNVSCL